MTNTPDHNRNRNEDTMAAALKPFGWECGPTFWKVYYQDEWVFNLANAVERLTERNAARDEAIIDATVAYYAVRPDLNHRSLDHAYIISDVDEDHAVRFDPGRIAEERT